MADGKCVGIFRIVGKVAGVHVAPAWVDPTGKNPPRPDGHIVQILGSQSIKNGDSELVLQSIRVGDAGDDAKDLIAWRSWVGQDIDLPVTIGAGRKGIWISLVPGYTVGSQPAKAKV